MIVKACKDCPFFHATALAMLARSEGGVCSYDRKHDRNVTLDLTLTPGSPGHYENRRAAWERMKIANPTVVPQECPLRTNDVIVTLGD